MDGAEARKLSLPKIEAKQSVSNTSRNPHGHARNHSMFQHRNDSIDSHRSLNSERSH